MAFSGGFRAFLGLKVYQVFHLFRGTVNKKASSVKFEAFDLSGDPIWIRTRDLQIRNLLLYPAEL